MDADTKKMQITMQDQLRAHGYSTVITNDRGEWVVMVHGLSNLGIMRLYYPDDTVTPEQVVSAVRDILDKLNGK